MMVMVVIMMQTSLRSGSRLRPWLRRRISRHGERTRLRRLWPDSFRTHRFRNIFRFFCIHRLAAHSAKFVALAIVISANPADRCCSFTRQFAGQICCGIFSAGFDREPLYSFERCSHLLRTRLRAAHFRLQLLIKLFQFRTRLQIRAGEFRLLVACRFCGSQIRFPKLAIHPCPLLFERLPCVHFIPWRKLNESKTRSCLPSR